MVESDAKRECAVCGKDDNTVPLVSLMYRGTAVFVCPQHMPVLIHDPARLVGTLPGAENLEPGEPDD